MDGSIGVYFLVLIRLSFDLWSRFSESRLANLRQVSKAVLDAPAILANTIYCDKRSIAPCTRAMTLQLELLFN